MINSPMVDKSGIIPISGKDDALLAPIIIMSPGTMYGNKNRQWQGIPGIAKAVGGRLWATFYSGGADEGNDNYVVLITSPDEEITWSEPKLVIDPPGDVRAFDPCLWMDPSGKLWLFWAQSYTLFDGRCGVWAITSANADVENPAWTTPRRIANGIMMNKPVILSTGEWLLPCAIWVNETSLYNDIPAEKYSNVYRSTDNGKTFHLFGSADIPNRSCDEHSIIERKDGSLWMLVRTTAGNGSTGIGQSFSHDKGASWSPGTNCTQITGPCSRFFIGRLLSGKLLLINHRNFTGRNNMTASLSDDDGKTWYGHLLLDGRDNVSYPDAIQDSSGRIFAIYDRSRREDKEILMAVFCEADIAAGAAVTSDSRLNIIVNRGNNSLYA